MPVDETPEDVSLESPRQGDSQEEVYRPIEDAESDPEEIPEEAEPYDWFLWVTTGKEKHMGTNAEVFLIVYGEKGHTDPLPLNAPEGGDNPFKSGAKDEFKVNFGRDIGQVFKVRIGHEEPDESQGWYLEKLKMKDLNTNEVLKFRFNRWMSRGEDDEDTWREQPAVRPEVAPCPMVTYVVEVYTGTVPNADTRADAYIHLFGSHGDAGRRALVKSRNNVMFLRGQKDIFEIEAVSLEAIEKVIIGHNATKRGSGWYVERVVVREGDESDAATFHFPCGRWLDSGQDDKKIERVLLPGDPPVEESFDWTVWTTTGGDSDMGTSEPVVLVAYGDKGHTKPLPLTSKDKKARLFQPGKTDEFKVNLNEDIGRLYKIRVGHDSANPDQGWFLERVKVKDHRQDEVFTFENNRWLARGQDDSDTWREMAAVYPGEAVLPAITYIVEVQTGNERGADTDANCYIHLFGSRGDAGRRALVASNQRKPFRRGQVDEFRLDAVSLDRVEKVVLGHDGKEKGAGWYVSNVVVRESEPADEKEAREFYFPCDRWFDSGVDDRKIERELKPGNRPEEQVQPEEEPEPEEKEEGYLLTVKTSPDSRAPRRAAVTLTVYGSEGKTDDIPLTSENLEKSDGQASQESSQQPGNKMRNRERKSTPDNVVGDGDLFFPGSEHCFNIEMDDIGEFYKIRIGRQDDDDWDGWLLDEVSLIEKKTKEEYKFKFDRWMARDEDDFDIVRELPVVKEGQEPLPVVPYEVSVYTGDHWAAATDANVYLHLYGSRGDAGRRLLYHSQNMFKFQRNQVDTFTVEAVSLEDIERVVVGHDGVGHGAGWFLDKIIITPKGDQDKSEKSQKDTQKANEQKKSNAKQTDQKKGKGNKNDKRDVEESDSSPNRLVFYCGRWLDTEEDDGQTERELSLMEIVQENTPSESSNKPPTNREKTKTPTQNCLGSLFSRLRRRHKKNNAKAEKETKEKVPDDAWEVTIKTSDLENAGTQAQVYITAYGRLDTSDRLELGKAGSKDFMRGKETTQKIKFGDIGDIYKVLVEHDNRGSSPAWHLQMLTMKKASGGEPVKFYSNCWLSAEEEDGTLYRELPAIYRDEAPTPVLKYQVSITTCDADDAETSAVVYLSIVGSEGRADRRPLLAPSSGDVPWRRGQTDQFEIESVYLGALSEVILEHDGEGEDSAWLVEKVVIKETTHAIQEWIFPANEVIILQDEKPASGTFTTAGATKILPPSSDEGDEATREEEPGDEKPKSKGSWEVTVDGTELPPEGSLRLVAFGLLGESKPLLLLGDEEDNSDAEQNGESNDKKQRNKADTKQDGKRNSDGKDTGKNEGNRKDDSPKRGQTDKKSQKRDSDDKKKSSQTKEESKEEDEKDEDEKEKELKERKEKAMKDLQTTQNIMVDVGDIGEIFKVRLIYVGDEDLFLYRLKLKDCDTQQEFHMLHDDWLSTASDAAPSTRDLAAIRPDTTPLLECVYEMKVMTGDLPRAETDAQLYCNVVGSWGDTGRYLLESSLKNQTKFRQGQTDVFQLNVLEVGDVKHVTLGHDTIGRGLGWYCNHVTIRKKDQPRLTVFPCNRWFDTGCEDRAVVRDLLPDVEVAALDKDNEENGPITNGIWQLRLTMATEDELSTNNEKDGPKGQKNEKNNTENKPSQDENDKKDPQPYGSYYEPGRVMMVLYGENGVSRPLAVVTGTDDIILGTVFEKELAVGDIGKIHKARLIDGTLHEGETLAWQIAQVAMTDADTKEELVFDFKSVVGQRTVSAHRELPALRDGERVKPVIDYKVIVHCFDEAPSTGGDEESGKSEDSEDKQTNGREKSDPPKGSTTKDKRGGKDDKKNKEKDNKNVKNSKERKDDEDIEKDTGKDDAEKEKEEIWICLHGTNGDSGWHLVPVTKVKLEPTPSKDGDQTEASQSSKTEKDDNNKANKDTKAKSKDDPKSTSKTKNSTEKDDQRKKGKKPDKKQEKKDKSEAKKEQAAIKIQAGFRGYQARKRVKAMRQALDEKEDFVTLSAVDLGIITKVTVINTSQKDIAVKEVIIGAGQFSVRNQIFNCFRVLRAKSKEADDNCADTSMVSERLSDDEEVEFTDYYFDDFISPAAVPLEKTPELPESEGRWLVTVETGDDPEAGASGDVAIVVCGRLKETEPILLTDAITENDVPFQPGQKDTFKITIPGDIGDIFKLRVGFSLQQVSQSWCLKKIHFVDESTDDTFTCGINGWLHLNDTYDGKLEAPVLWPSVPMSPLRRYEIAVHTGDVANAGTDANVYLIVQGRGGTSGRRELRKAKKNETKFEKGEVDIFTLEVVDMSDLQVATVGHDGFGIGSGWFLEKIIIEEGDTVESALKEGDDKDTDEGEDGHTDTDEASAAEPQLPRRTFIFPCSRWLDEGEDDGLIERYLEPLPPEEPVKEYTWKVSIKTAEAAGTDEPAPPSSAQRVLVLYGEHGKSEELPLVSTKNNVYFPGFTDDFVVTSKGELGELYKIRLGYAEDTEGDHNWHLEMVSMRCMETKEKYYFDAGGVSVVRNAERDGWTELPVREAKEENQLPVRTYVVETHTGYTPGSGTDANVYLEVYGERGDTGRRRLLHTLTDGRMFENGMVDIFNVEAVDLSDLVRVVIGHDGQGFGSGWFLEKVIIKESETASKKYVFDCDRWMDEGEDDGALERSLELTDVLDDSEDVNDGDFKVLVKTSDGASSGTDAKVTLTVFGDKGSSKPLPLNAEAAEQAAKENSNPDDAEKDKTSDKAEKKLFEDGSTDEFRVKISPVRVGKIRKIRIEHDNSGSASGWRVDKIVLVDLYDKEREDLEFKLDRWLCDDEEDGDVVREVAATWPGEDPLPVTKYQVQTVTGEKVGAGTDASVYITLHGKKGDSGKRYLRKNEEGRDKFEGGKTDTFTLEAIDLGDIKRVTIGHDQKGAGAGWHLDKVIVKESKDAQEEIVFPCSDWLEEENGSTERQLERQDK